MNISDKLIHDVLHNYTRHIEKTKPRESTEKASQGKKPRADEVVLSDRAREARLIRDILRDTPLVREERVQRLKELIEKGEYNVSASDVAEKMLSQILDGKWED